VRKGERKTTEGLRTASPNLNPRCRRAGGTQEPEQVTTRCEKVKDGAGDQGGSCGSLRSNIVIVTSSQAKLFRRAGMNEVRRENRVKSRVVNEARTEGEDGVIC
jgi:hypothetical protein